MEKSQAGKLYSTKKGSCLLSADKHVNSVVQTDSLQICIAIINQQLEWAAVEDFEIRISWNPNDKLNQNNKFT